MGGSKGIRSPHGSQTSYPSSKDGSRRYVRAHTCVRVYAHMCMLCATWHARLCHIVIKFVANNYVPVCHMIWCTITYNVISYHVMSCHISQTRSDQIRSDQIMSCHTLCRTLFYLILYCVAAQHMLLPVHLCVLYCIVFQYGISTSKYGIPLSKYGRHGILSESILSCSVLHRIILYYSKTYYLNRYQPIPG